MSGRQHRETEIARRIRAAGLAAGRTSAQIADEIHEQCSTQFGTSRIKAHRLGHGIALADVIEQIRALFERDRKSMPGIGETLLSAYESGLKRPGPEYMHYLCTVYRVEPHELGYDGPCICGHGHRLSGVLNAEAKELPLLPTERELLIQPMVTEPDAEEDENILRRTLLNLLNQDAGSPSALDGPVLGACEGIRRRMDETLVSATVSAAMLDQWEEATLSFGRQYTTTAPLRLLCDVLLEMSAVRTAMSRRQPIDLHDRLLRMAAQLSGLSGMIMINLGDHRLARSFFRTGRTAADETGDRALRAWICARESLVPLYFGDAREALNLAKKSRDLAGNTACAAQAMAPVVEARALAMLSGGESKKEVVEQAKRALAKARSAFTHMKTEDQEDMAFGYTEKQLYFYQGDVLTKLGQTLEAEVVLDQALEKYQDHILDQTLIRLDQAQCRLLDGELDSALEIGTRALRMVGDEYMSDLILRPALALEQAIMARNAEHAMLPEFRAELRRPRAGLKEGGA
ncbi:XRE family transcriptional regulator [Nonomuraea phyllanthi]|uniref:XRE family transcriptional regulator n=1 Tax=Nonomuraea phyllanthi TaxID=2219224 RepID=A0A5C4VZK0_9ACTN|nr:XRE family transcriptional regulator [Nonomuraea phyllanthi]KAB8190842.1 XRE family transcriptional regulator [Nonomuraea phyllanthi]QFY11837.1 XRE family transcriptional regulator [Nonomuraea phyllanthi]